MADRRTTILADADLLDRLDRFADRQRTTKTALIIAALEAYLAEHDAAPGAAVPRRSAGAGTAGCRSTGARSPRREAGRRRPADR